MFPTSFPSFWGSHQPPLPRTTGSPLGSTPGPPEQPGNGRGSSPKVPGAGTLDGGGPNAICAPPTVKVAPPDNYDGRGKPTASAWLIEVGRWLQLNRIPWEVQVDATASRLKGGALT